jgi:hypothetical protein
VTASFETAVATTVPRSTTFHDLDDHHDEHHHDDDEHHHDDDEHDHDEHDRTDESRSGWYIMPIGRSTIWRPSIRRCR